MTAGSCDLPRFTARGKGKAGARALARQRSVTSPRRTGPHVGLFGSRQAPPLPRPRPPCQDGDVREPRWDGRLALCFPAFRPASFLRRARTSELGHSLDLACHLPPGLSPGPAAVGPQPRATSPASRWSHCFVSPHGAESLSVLGFGRAHRKTCSADLTSHLTPCTYSACLYSEEEALFTRAPETSFTFHPRQFTVTSPNFLSFVELITCSNICVGRVPLH